MIDPDGYEACIRTDDTDTDLRNLSEWGIYYILYSTVFYCILLYSTVFYSILLNSTVLFATFINILDI